MILRIAIICAILSQLPACSKEPAVLEPYAGMIISSSTRIKPGTYHLQATEGLGSALITIRGENIEVDFEGVELKGSLNGEDPDNYKGVAIKVEGGENIRIENVSAHGYKLGLLAEGVDSLQLVDADFSYNYRPRLLSKPEKENPADILDLSQNDKDQWLVEGAAVFLKDCDHALIKGLHVTGGQNGLMLSGSQHCLLYNNIIRFNSGVGIGLYGSSSNRMLHNSLDWNVRGYSLGHYQSGQGSAGIYCAGENADNTFAYNSVTHSGSSATCADNNFYHNTFAYSLDHLHADDPSATFSINNTTSPPSAMPDGMDVTFSPEMPAGPTAILMSEWGPYDFRYPAAFLRSVEKDNYIFLLQGPRGNWKLSGGDGFAAVKPKTGAFPSTVSVRENGRSPLHLEWTFIGEASVGVQGDSLARGEEVVFGYRSK